MIKKGSKEENGKPCEHLEECKLSSRPIWYLDACDACEASKAFKTQFI